MPMSNVVEAAAGKVDATTINNGQVQVDSSTVKTGPVGGAEHLPTFYEEVLRAKAVRALSPEGEEFKKVIIERLKAEGVKCDILPQSNCYLFHDNAASIGVLFEEHLPIPGDNDMLPKSNYINQAYAEAEHLFRKYPIVTVEICTVNDYDRVNQWVYYISRVLQYSYRDIKVFSLKDIVQDEKQNLFRVITNKHAVDRVVNDMSIHGVLPHYQYGVVLEMCTDRNNSQYRNNYQWNPAQDDLNWTPIMVIPGYTSFVVQNALNFNDVKYTPQVHISEPICLFPTLKMLPLAVSLALQYFVSGQMWKEPFSQYDAKSPNIGSLWIKPETGEPDFVPDINTREQFIGARCTPPVLMIDFSHGRNSIPGLSLLASDRFQPVFLNMFDEFFGTSNVYTQFGKVIAMPFFEYTGAVALDGKAYDSKCFDYFRVLSACGNQREVLDKFINIPFQPEAKLNALRAIGYNVKSMYNSAMCVINPNMVLEIASAIGSQLNVINAIGIDNRYYADMSIFDRAATVLRDGMMRNSGMFFTNNGRSIYSNDPFGNNTAWNVWGSRY